MTKQKTKSTSSGKPGEQSLSRVEAQEKQELQDTEEHSFPGRYYVPQVDIYENSDSVYVLLEVPGARREGVDVQLDQDVLSVEARIDSSNYAGLSPRYTEYNVGHFFRRFRLPAGTLDADRITATLADGVLTLELGKTAAARTRRVAIE